MFEIIDEKTGARCWSETYVGALAKLPRRDGTVRVEWCHLRPDPGGNRMSIWPVDPPDFATLGG